MKRLTENNQTQTTAYAQAKDHGKSVWDFSLNLHFLSILQPKLSVELGVYKGSTFQLLHNFSTKAIGFDINVGQDDYQKDWDKDWDIRVMDTKNITPKDFDHEEINFAHIDASHEFLDVLKDYEIITNNLSVDGIICIDDYITHRDVFTATNYFLREHRDFTLVLKGFDQAYITRSEGAKIIHDVISNFDKNILDTLKIENIYSMNIIPRHPRTDVDYAIRTQKFISEDIKKFYKEFNL